MEVVVTGSSGLIGTALVGALNEAGHRPVRMVRRDPQEGEDEIKWNPETGEIDSQSLEGVDAVVHLAGAGIGDKRWSASYKKVLTSSRTRSTFLLASTLASMTSPPKRFLSGSAIGFYGNGGEEILTEESSPGTGFLADLTQKWESATQSAIDAGIQTAWLRTGTVLSSKGGALKKMLPFFRLGLGGKFGDGSQSQSWISLTDEVRAILHLLASDVSGPVNLTAPNPVSNSEFTRTLGDVLNRPTFLPVPAFGPQILLGKEMANALLFESTNILPMVLTEDDFRFEHSEIEQAFKAEIPGD